MTDSEFWHEIWKSDGQGFHRSDFHPLLTHYWPTLDLDHGSAVLVPLCGKSRDMVWLINQGHQVVGVELSEIAAEAFFVENALDYERDRIGSFARYRGAGCTLLCGDVFNLTRELVGNVAAVYDRAALIALPPATQRAYAQLLRSLSSPATEMLLITLTYGPDTIVGPPFSVVPEDVSECYGDWCAIGKLRTVETTLKDFPVHQTAYRLTVA